MTDRQYIEQNKKGYEGDSFIGLEIGKLVTKFQVEEIIETGTFIGSTTKRLLEFAPVRSVEIVYRNYQQAVNNLENEQQDRLILAFGNSVTLLKEWLPKIKDKSLLFFLDAHWHDYCPLLDEMKTIAENGIKPVIVIHDFKVPERPDLGFDSYKGQDFTFSYIKDAIELIYGHQGYAFHYNEQAEGAKRGVIYIYPVK